MNQLRNFIGASQRTRTIVRGLTCRDGFCLIVERDGKHAGVLKSLLESAGLRCQIAGTVDDAMTILNEHGASIICVIIDHAVNGNGTGFDVIRELEGKHAAIPYVLHTNDRKAAFKASDRFPRANIVLKGEDVTRLLDAVGLTV